MIHNFGSLSYQYDETPRSKQNDPLIFFSGGECDETEIMLRYWKIRDGDVVIDAGAHIGSWTLPALVMGASHVYCFEPSKKNCESLARNLRLNHFVNATIFQKALWHKKDVTAYYEYENSILPPNRGFRTIEGDEYDIQCVTLDSYNFDRADWIKIDVEGSELAVLIGARETLSRLKPKMIIEIHMARIREVIPTFRYEDIKNWLPPANIIKIEGSEDTPRILVLPT